MATRLNGTGDRFMDSFKFRKKEQLVEVSVFIFLIMPSMALSFFAVKEGTLGFTLVAFSTMLRDLALLSLILFFLWRNGESMAAIGWSAKKIWREITMGVLMFVPFLFGTNFLEQALLHIGFSTPKTPLPSMEATGGILESVLGMVLVAIVAIAEESIFRGYLILRFRAIGASMSQAVILSALIFSLGHGYEGSAGVITVAVIGIVFAVVYLWRQSLVAPVVMHFLLDLISIVILPLFKMNS